MAVISVAGRGRYFVAVGAFVVAGLGPLLQCYWHRKSIACGAIPRSQDSGSR